jgi:hypothetical protein
MTILIWGSSTCPLCNKLLSQEECLVQTTAFVEDPKHPMWRFSDACMHRDCFLIWPDRDNFISCFNDFYGSHYRGIRHMLPDGTIEEREPQ